MAWTAPRDWSDNSDVPNGIVTAAMLNTDVRDNLLFLGGTSDVTTGHTHTGAAGMGAASMSGLTLTALANLTFADTGAPDAAGELQRHGNDLKWYGSSVVNLTQADASAGTASLRTLGTTSVKAAAGNHTHEVEGVTANLYNTPQGGLQTTTWMGGAAVGTALAAIAGTTQSPTFTGDNRSRVLTGVWVGGHNDTVEDVDYTVALFIDGSQVASVTRTLPQVSAVSGVDVQFGNAITVTYVEASADSGDEVILKVMHEAVGSANYHSTMGGGLANYFVTAV